jgi:hypothetical protein
MDVQAELSKMPKAEAEYRRELMARSQQEMKMEMGFEQGLKAGLDVYKSVMQKFGGHKILQSSRCNIFSYYMYQGNELSEFVQKRDAEV